MKSLLLLFFALPIVSLGQDCSLKHAKDPFTKLETLSTGFIPVQGGSITIDASKTDVDLLFSITGPDKCFTDASTAAIYFANSKVKLTQRNNGSMNCEGLFHITSRNTSTPAVLLRKLATVKVEKIVFMGNNKTESTLVLTPEQQQAFMERAACMVKEAPGLL